MKKFYFLTLALICAIAANAEVTIYAQKSGILAEKANLWAWDNNNNYTDGVWPGKAATETFEKDGNTYWKWTIEPQGETFNIIFNNGSEQTVDITNLSSSEEAYWYMVNESKRVFNLNDVLYLNATNLWNVDGAWFAAYFFGSEGEIWTKLTKVKDNVFSTIKPYGDWKVIFVRMDSAKTALEWGSKWNQTGDLTIENNLFTISTSDGAGSWSAADDTLTAIEEVGVDAGAAVYYNLQGVKVANPENGIFIKKQGSKTTKVVL